MRAAFLVFVLSTAAAFLFAAADKLATPDKFARLLDAHAIVPSLMTTAAARVLPAMELVLGAGIIAAAASRRTTQAATLAASGLGVFALYAALVAISPPSTPVGCGCGFSDEPANWAWLTLRNAAWSTALLIGGRLAGDSATSPHPSPAPGVHA